MPLVQAFDNTLSTFFDRMVDGAVSDPFRSHSAARPLVPAVDVENTDEAVLVHMDLPGMSKEAIDVRFQEGVLEVSGSRQFAAEEPYIAQRWKGDFQRRIRIKDPIDATNVSASYLDGVLTITLPHRTPPDGIRVTVA